MLIESLTHQSLDDGLAADVEFEGSLIELVQHAGGEVDIDALNRLNRLNRRDTTASSTVHDFAVQHGQHGLDFGDVVFGAFQIVAIEDHHVS